MIMPHVVNFVLSYRFVFDACTIVKYSHSLSIDRYLYVDKQKR